MKARKTAWILLAALLAGPAGAQQGAPRAAGSPAQIERMQQNLKAMEAQLDRIANAGSEAERQAALAEHMASMQAQMQMAMAQRGSSTDCPMGAAGMGMMGGPGMQGDLGSRMHQMEQRLDMMQMMMQGMMGGSAPGRMPMQ